LAAWYFVIHQRKAAKVRHIQFPIRVVAYHRTGHDEDTGFFGLFDELTQGVRPGRQLLPLAHGEAQLFTHGGGDTDRGVMSLGGAHKRHPRQPVQLRIFAEPVLPLLAQLERVEQLRAGLCHRPVD
jgi:hypothetical protein